MKLRNFAVGILSALVITTAAVSAEVIFDPQTGAGFVGKGDVQLALGLNNAQLQARAANLTFTFDAIDTYELTCEWWTGPAHNRKLHSVEHERSYGVSASVDYDARKRNQVNGFILTGLVGGTSTQAPVLGGACPNGNSGIIVELELLSSTGALKVDGVTLQ